MLWFQRKLFSKHISYSTVTSRLIRWRRRQQVSVDPRRRHPVIRRQCQWEPPSRCRKLPSWTDEYKRTRVAPAVNHRFRLSTVSEKLSLNCNESDIDNVGDQQMILMISGWQRVWKSWETENLEWKRCERNVVKFKSCVNVGEQFIY